MASDKVYVFVDNSNLWIEAKFNLGTKFKRGRLYTERRRNGQWEWTTLSIEHGLLLKRVLSGRSLGADPLLVGSRPPLNDSLWERIRQQGFSVVVYDRNPNNKEKQVDVELATQMTETIFTKEPATIVFIGGDVDLLPPLRRALERKWKVELWFWEGSVAGELRDVATRFYRLEDCYMQFCFCREQFKYRLQISDGDILRQKKDADLLSFCNTRVSPVGIVWTQEGSVCVVSFLEKSERDQAHETLQAGLPDVCRIESQDIE